MPINTTYRIPVKPVVPTTQTVNSNYPKGVTLPLGFTASKFAPPQRGEKFVAADALKGKNRANCADSRIVTAKQNNSPESSARVIVVAQ